MDRLQGEPAKPEAQAQEVADGLLAALREFDKDATVSVEIKDHPYLSERKMVWLNTVVLGHPYPVNLGIARRSTSRFSHTYTEAVQIETGLHGHLRRVKMLKNGKFNFARLADGLVDEARRRKRQAEASAKTAANADAHAQLINSINAVRNWTARASTSEARPIRISVRIDDDLTPEKAELVLRFLREFTA